MTNQPTMEERFALLEARVAELERQRRTQEDRDVALLARVDGFIDDLRRIERVQLRAFDELKADQQELKAGQKDLQAGQHNLEQALTDIAGTLKNHKEAIETVAGRVEIVVGQTGELAGHVGELAVQVSSLTTGQQQIIALLSNKPPLHD